MTRRSPARVAVAVAVASISNATLPWLTEFSYGTTTSCPRIPSEGGSHEERSVRVGHHALREQCCAGRDQDRDHQGERLEVRQVPAQDPGEAEGAERRPVSHGGPTGGRDP